MRTRRSFLGTLAGGAAFAASMTRSTEAFASKGLDGPIGLQLWSLRADLPKDIPGTLSRVRELGITEVEAAGLWGKTIEEFRTALDDAGLRCQAAHMPLERIRDDAAGTLDEARGLGATRVVCPWIPHEGEFSREDALRAADAFNTFGRAARESGSSFAYHPHGYEFLPSPEGTLFDTLAKETDAELVGFEIDVFWAFAGGANPAELIRKYSGRVPLLHVKDMVKGLTLPPGSSGAPHETNVTIGTGQIDWPAVLKAAKASGTEIYYLEDESPDPWAQLPGSIAYLNSLEL